MDTRENLARKRLDLIVDMIYDYLDSSVPNSIKLKYLVQIIDDNVFFLFTVDILNSSLDDIEFVGSFRVKESRDTKNNYNYIRTNWSGKILDNNSNMTNKDLVISVSKWIINSI